jgi:hypothetical protein
MASWKASDERLIWPMPPPPWPWPVEGRGDQADGQEEGRSRDDDHGW